MTASGVAPAAASRITVDDVKAADSDQVPVSVDVDGEIIAHVPADWYDRVVHAREVRDRVANNHKHRPSIIGIGYDPATRDRGTPAVKGIFNDNHPRKNSEKGKIPGEQDGIPIEKQEEKEPTKDSCSSSSASHACSNYDCEPLPFGWDIPGGAAMETRWLGDGSTASHTSSAYDGNGEHGYGWMICAHQAVNCNAAGEMYHQPKGDGGYKVGEVVEIFPQYDFAFVKATRGVDDNILPSPYVHESSDLQYGDRYGPIEATMSEDAVAMWAEDGNKRAVFRYGMGSCYDNGTIDGVYPGIGEECGQIQIESLRVNMQSENGDSGGLHFGYYEEQDIYLGIGFHWGSVDRPFLSDIAWATPGYRIKQDLGYFWS